MNTSVALASTRAAARRRPAAARAVLHMLSRLHGGTLELLLPDGSRTCFGDGAGIAASIELRDWSVFARVLKGGDIGFAEAWIDGLWQTQDPVALLRLLLANRAALEQAIHGSLAGKWLYWLRHRVNRNSRRGSARNIHAHYDLGNAFYAQWLDETMSYSSALFEGDATRSLAQAQRAKMRRALNACGIGPGDRLLEIGCGWGALAETAAVERGARVTGITLSREQLVYGQRRLAQAGLAGHCELQLCDYRDLPARHETQPFDAVVSIEMFEAVGESYWPGYFDALRRCLKPGGRACIQTITIDDALYRRYRRSTDFIQQYIFPGGQLPSVSAFRAACERAGLVVEEAFRFGADYARTLRSWREAFLACTQTLPALGFDARFVRIWHFYLAYCEAAFAAGDTDVVQFTVRRP